MNVLIIDNNMDPDCWGSHDLKALVTQKSDITAHVRRAPHGDLPASMKAFDRLVISGSRTSCLAQEPWIDRLDEIVREALNLGRPILGICYGHQTLNRVLGGREILRRGSAPEFGWGEVEVLVENPLLKGLPPRFHTYQSHWEEVATLPRGMRHLARSTHCEIQACQLEDRPVFGIQFHPEKSLEDGNRALQEKLRKKDAPQLLNPHRGSELFQSSVGETVFRNFLSL